MPIHEKSLIRPENLHVHEKLEIDGVDVSGHWSTFIEPRVVTDYNEEKAVAAGVFEAFLVECTMQRLDRTLPMFSEAWYSSRTRLQILARYHWEGSNPGTWDRELVKLTLQPRPD